MVVAASLIDSLSRIGAITGIVSFIGLGLMILLVAGQSRQIRAMREWIDAEPERQAETAQRVIAEVQRRIAAARERRAAQVAPPSAPPARVPAPAPGTLGATPEARAVAAAKAADTVAAPTPAAAPDGESVPPPTGDEAPKFAPLTPAAESESGDEPPISVAASAEDLLSDPVTSDPGQDTQPADALPADYDPLGAATPAAQASDPRFADDHFDLHDEHDEAPHRGNRVLFGVGAAALIAGIVLAGTLLFGGGGDAPTPADPDVVATQPDGDGGDTGAGNGDSAGGTTSDAIEPSTVRVMVLNGTQVNRLAQSLTDQLSGQGYSTNQPNTLSAAQAASTTVVYYRQGQTSKARQVAKDLGLQSDAAQPMTAEVGAAAPETAQVVVVAGLDMASSAGGGSQG